MLKKAQFFLNISKKCFLRHTSLKVLTVISLFFTQKNPFYTLRRGVFRYESEWVIPYKTLETVGVSQRQIG
jgi:hypothetical protein